MRDPVRVVGGALTAGVVALAVALVVIWALAAAHGQPGPGAPVLAGHLAAAAVAVALQRVADRRADRTGTLAAIAVLLLVAVLVGVYWWN
ncbi:hypothetical protein [Pseudonocardia acaciae]|uniref:hypothetical protein n=1 Tax=Pseudonocardia acaciae TaxID=551276 RepID=UPI0006846361|nr:hypothetical protein [Pseudonocardia acaciae]